MNSNMQCDSYVTWVQYNLNWIQYETECNMTCLRSKDKHFHTVTFVTESKC